MPSGKHGWSELPFPVAGVEKSSCELFRRGTAHDAQTGPEPDLIVTTARTGPALVSDSPQDTHRRADRTSTPDPTPLPIQ